MVAANRDEYLRPPGDGAGDRSAWRTARCSRPRDARAGGTWLGLNDGGRIRRAHQPTEPDPDASRRSRGLLVLDALAEAAAAGRAAERLAALPPGPTTRSTCSSRTAATPSSPSTQERPRVTELAPGAHVIGNADPDDRSVAKVARLLDEAERVAAGPRERWLDGLAARVPRPRRRMAPLGAACVHHGGYGTRSSTLLRIDADPARSELRFSEGPPCRAELRDLSPLLLELPHPGAAAASGAQVGSLR